ncbi:hypothetical protein M8C21_017944 [Ambrosia artemisiifolia]|uniref:Uncharacterized protein n=1 Tax=Ambrosia artemisiifolia TaxID=4212 RepID=A0AAD5BN22_AMBAR|nr:hypothetical protein M8C21_017944 [Ambrosia artemisiifolia]
MSKSYVGDKSVAFTSSLLEEEVKSDARSELIDEAMEEVYNQRYASDDEDFIITLFDFEPVMEESHPYTHEPKEGYKLENDGMSKAFFGKEDKPRYEEHNAPLKRKRSSCFCWKVMLKKLRNRFRKVKIV